MAQPASDPADEPTSVALRPHLRNLLEQELIDETSVADLMSDPEVRRNLIDALPRLQDEACRVAGAHGVRLLLKEAIPVYPATDRSQSQWVSFYRWYEKVLGGVPFADLQMAMLAAMSEPREYLPSPGVLLELSRNGVSPEKRLFERARALVDGVRGGNCAALPSEADGADASIWQAVRAEMKTTLGAETFKSWVERAYLGRSGQQLYVVVYTGTAVDWFRRGGRRSFEDAWAAADPMRRQPTIISRAEFALLPAVRRAESAA
jgi:hypothetical protein